MKLTTTTILTVAALVLQCAPSHAQGWRYYGNRSGESVGFADGLSQAPGGGLSVGPGGGLSVGPGGGLSVGPGGGLSVGPGGGLSVGPGGGLSQGPHGGLSVGPGGGLSVAMLGGLSVAPCGGLAVAPCGLPAPQRLNYPLVKSPELNFKFAVAIATTTKTKVLAHDLRVNLGTPLKANPSTSFLTNLVPAPTNRPAMIHAAQCISPVAIASLSKKVKLYGPVDHKPAVEHL